jgi:hypothetical protein
MDIDVRCAFAGHATAADGGAALAFTFRFAKSLDFGEKREPADR